jgi:hypothetical protein
MYVENKDNGIQNTTAKIEKHRTKTYIYLYPFNYKYILRVFIEERIKVYIYLYLFFNYKQIPRLLIREYTNNLHLKKRYPFISFLRSLI